MKIFNITCSVNDNFLQHCFAMLCSVFENNKDAEIKVHMLVDESLSQKSRERIKDLASRYSNTVFFYDVNPEVVSKFDENKSTSNGVLRFPMLVYYRLLLTEYIPKTINTILYLDCDTIIVSPLDDLFSLNMVGYGIAAIRDSSPFNNRHRNKMGLGMQHSTFCSGVMVINLDYWRDCNIIKQFEDYFSRDKSFVCLPDQDVLNYLFRDSWLQLPYKWGRTSLSFAVIDSCQKWFDVKEYAFAPCIYHYSSIIKPWLDVRFPERKYYWYFLAISGFENPQIHHTNYKFKIKAYFSILRYLINRYIRPFIPIIIELLIVDVLNILLIIFNIFRPSRLREKLLRNWLKRYK